MRKGMWLGSIFLGVVLLLGCAALSSIDLNPTVARIATGQALKNYIKGGDTQAEKAQRKQDLVIVFGRTLEYIDSDVRASPDDVLRVFVSMVDWDSLSSSDRILAVEGIQLIQFALQERIRDGELQSDSVLFVRGIVSSALDYLQYM